MERDSPTIVKVAEYARDSGIATTERQKAALEKAMRIALHVSTTRVPIDTIEGSFFFYANLAVA
jgi:hypothetical protein